MEINLKYEASKIVEDEKIEVEICLNNENECQTWSITCMGYKKTQKGWKFAYGGCYHDRIIKIFPEFKIFCDLHLSDYKGAPLFTVGNGYYYIEKYRAGEVPADAPKKYLRIIDEELIQLVKCEDKDILQYQLYKLGIVDRWQRESSQAIKYLEELTGKVFRVNSIKSHIYPVSDETKLLIEERLANGYYFPKNIRRRKEIVVNKEKQRRIKELQEEARKEIEKIENELKIRLYVVEAGLPDDNFIYYSSTKRAVFNWKDYDSKISVKDFDNFLKNVDYLKLPEGITFELKQV